MRSFRDNYTREVLGCGIWIVLLVALFFSGIGDRVINRLRPGKELSSEASISVISFPTPVRDWQWTDGGIARGRVLNVDGATEAATFEFSHDSSQETVPLSRFSPEDLALLLQRPAAHGEKQ